MAQSAPGRRSPASPRRDLARSTTRKSRDYRRSHPIYNFSIIKLSFWLCYGIGGGFFFSHHAALGNVCYPPTNHPCAWASLRIAVKRQPACRFLAETGGQQGMDRGLRTREDRTIPLQIAALRERPAALGMLSACPAPGRTPPRGRPAIGRLRRMR